MKPNIAFTAPHRIGFLLGSLLLIASLAWWAVEILARQHGATLGAAVPAMFQHGYLMLYGFFPLFMLGFIYTAGPRWLSVPPPPLARYVPVMLAYGAGSALVLAGGWMPLLLTVGIVLHIVGWAGSSTLWWGRVRASQTPDRKHAVLIGAAFSLGLLGQLLALYWRVADHYMAWQLSVHIGLWGFLLPVFLVVSHRMVPFFSSGVLAPYALWVPTRLLFALVGAAWLHGVLAIFNVPSWPLDSVYAAVLLFTSWRWGLLRSFKNPLLAMLHAAFAWSGVAMLLYAVQGIAAQLDVLILGFAPLHALTIGFFATMLLGFVTRVSLGHSGRPLIAGRLPWTLYWLVHGIALTRVLAEISPDWRMPMYVASAVGALLAFAVWGSRFVPIYLKPRPDGKAG